MSINTGAVRFTTGEYKVVQTQGRALRENIVPLQMPGPNPVLLQLMQFLVESAKDIGSIKDVLTGDIPGANVPGILGLAVIQQGLKVFNSIFKRVHRSLRKDYELLFRLNRLYLPDEAGFRIGSEYFSVTREDYERGGGAEPVSDPDMVTDTQQMAQANFLLQFAQDPFFDGREIRLRAMQAAAIQQVDKLIAPQAPPNAAIAAQLAQLDIEKQSVDVQKHLAMLRSEELQIRASKQEAELDIRRGKDKAMEIRELTQAILNLANARKADHDVDQNWYALQLQNLRHQIDLLNTSAESEPVENSPAAASRGDTGAEGIAAGLAHAGVPGLAPPSGDAGGAALPGGLS
jgi:chaperonin GroES